MKSENKNLNQLCKDRHKGYLCAGCGKRFFYLKAPLYGIYWCCSKACRETVEDVFPKETLI